MTDNNALSADKQILVPKYDLNEMIYLLQAASEALNQLRVVYKCISDKSERHGDVFSLAKVGLEVSENWANVLDVEHEKYEEAYLKRKIKAT